MSEAMEAEFGTVAEWTADVAVDLGPEYYLPAACRGSGSPAALDWLCDRMGLDPGQTLLDCGAGVGGPAAYAATTRAVRPVLAEPEPGACRAAAKLFDHPVVCATGSALPFAAASFEAAWALGVLCTTTDQLSLLRELRRTLRSRGAIGLLVFVATSEIAQHRLGDNHFPSHERLGELIERASLRVEQRVSTSELPTIPGEWEQRERTVTALLAERHGHRRAWQLSQRQSASIGELLADGHLTGELLVLTMGGLPTDVAG